MADAIRTYLNLREWSDLAYLLDLSWGFWLWVGVAAVGAIGMWIFRPSPDSGE
jgi:hypothetical protein